MIRLNINGFARDVDTAPDTPLLWALREHLGLTGAKYGCGVAACGACTVHVDGIAVRSCSLPVSAAVGKKIVTIEGLTAAGNHPLVQAWIAEQAPQCGYCQSGQIMTAAALLAKNPKPSREQIIEAMDGNLCRCGSYPQIVAAVERVSKGA